MKKLVYQIVCFFILLHSSSVIAQVKYETEEKILKDAEKFYKEKSYAKAFPLFSQILSLHPRDFIYNYKFGVCLLFANEDPERVIIHLDYATKYSKIDPLAYYYLGRAYHLSYHFDEAITNFELFKKKANSSQIKALEVDLQIAMCYNAKQLMSNINDLYVLQKKDVSFGGFFRSYEMQNIGGTILAKSSDYTSSTDEKLENENALMFITKDRNYIYYSSYGKSDENGRDIYRVGKNIEGKWDTPENMGPAINTKYDEDYPYISKDGRTLYFCSKGHNSMGGYDIFRTTFDTVGQKWTQPVNLDFAINTPYDELLFIPDTLERYAFFSSDRTSGINMTSIYKVRIDKKPKVDENAVADIVNGNQASDDASKTKARKVIKDKSKLSVNTTEDRFIANDMPLDEKVEYETIDLNKVNKDNQKSQYKRAYSFVPVDDIPEVEITEKSTNQEILKSAKVENIKQKVVLDELTYKSNAAKKIASDKKNQSEKIIEASNKRREDAVLIEDASLKSTEIAVADSLLKEGVTLKKESAMIDDIASKLDEKRVLKQKEYEQSANFVKDVEASLNSKSPEKSTELLLQYNEGLTDQEETYNDEQFIGLIAPNQIDFQSKKADADQLTEIATKYKREADDLYADAEKLEQDAAATKKKDTKELYLNQAKGIKAEADENQEKYLAAKVKADAAQAQVDSLQNEIVTKQVLFDEVLETADENYTAYNKSNPQATVENQLKSVGVNYTQGDNKAVAQNESNQNSASEDVKVKSTKLSSQIKKQIDYNEQQYIAAVYLSNKKAEQAKQLSQDPARQGEAKTLIQESIAASEVAKHFSNRGAQLDSVYEISKEIESEIVKRVNSNKSNSAQALFDAQERIIEENESLITDKSKVDDIIALSAEKTYNNANKGAETAMSLESKINEMKSEVEKLKSESNDAKTPKTKKEEIDLQIQYTEEEISKQTAKLAELKSSSENLLAVSEALSNVKIHDNSLANELSQNTGKITKGEISNIKSDAIETSFVELNKNLASVEATPVLADNNSSNNNSSSDKTNSSVTQLNPDAVNPTDNESFIENENTKKTNTENSKSNSNESDAASADNNKSSNGDNNKSQTTKEVSVISKDDNKSVLVIETKSEEVISTRDNKNSTDETIANSSSESNNSNGATDNKQIGDNSNTSSESNVASDNSNSKLNNANANSETTNTSDSKDENTNNSDSQQNNQNSNLETAVTSNVDNANSNSTETSLDNSQNSDELNSNSQSSVTSDKAVNSSNSNENANSSDKTSVSENSTQVDNNSSKSVESSVSNSSESTVGSTNAKLAGNNVNSNGEAATQTSNDAKTSSDNNSTDGQNQVNSSSVVESGDKASTNANGEGGVVAGNKSNVENADNSNGSNTSQNSSKTINSNSDESNATTSVNEATIGAQISDNTVKAETNKKTYTVNKKALIQVRIDINDNSVYQTYSDTEPIFTAAQLETEADKYIGMIESNLAAADLETDLAKKNALLTDASNWGELVVANQKKAIELYTQARESVPVASVAEKSNDNSSSSINGSSEKQVAKSTSGGELAVKNEDSFLKNKSKIESIDTTSIAPDILALSGILVEDAGVYFETAKAKRLEADTTTNSDKKIAALNQAYDYELIAINKQEQAIDILGGSANLAQAVDNQLNNKTQYEVPAQPVLKTTESTSGISSETNVSNANSSEVNSTSSVEKNTTKSDESGNSSANSTDNSKSEGNSTNAVSKTSNLNNNNIAKTNPISAPVANIEELLDQKTYDGIVYKVQVAAFKSDVPYAMFNGITPISKEQSSNGFTRVMAGVFTSIEEANKTKLLAKQKGFNDAFIVAYMNGKRIAISQAQEAINKKEASVAQVETEIKFDAPVVYAKSNGYSVKADNSIALDESKDITKKEGLFYTVQIGVFSKPVAIESMFNVSNIYYEKLSSGQIRYYSGVYNDKSSASKQRIEISSKIKDAFVTAYYNGERISLTKALEYEKK